MEKRTAQTGKVMVVTGVSRGLTQALAEELPPEMCAVPLNPGIINTEMLRSCFASGAEFYPSPEAWAKRAVQFLLSLGSAQNGQPLTVPE